MFNKLLDWVKVAINNFKYNWPDLKTQITALIFRFCKRRWRRFQRVFERPKKLFKWIFYIIFLIKVRATPRNIVWFFWWCVMKFGSFIRSSFTILVTQNWYHHDIKFYVVINISIFFFLKFIQEIKYNFSCPVATLLYGKFVRTKRPHAIKKEEEMKKKKLHKFVKDPFKNRIERAKELERKQIEFDARFNVAIAKLRERLVKRNKWKKKNIAFLKAWRKKRKKIKFNG